jgi:HK97 family phage prohead protease
MKKAINHPLRKSLTAPVQITGERQAKFIFSSESVDREHDVIKQAGIDVSHFLANPVVFFQHEHDTAPIGRCTSIGIEGGNLVGVIEFAPATNPLVGQKASGLFELVRDGFLSTVSIGFIPKEISYPDGDRYMHDGVNVDACEMVEISVVGIPCNREATLVDVVAATAPDAPHEMITAALAPKKYHGPRLRRILAAMD